MESNSKIYNKLVRDRIPEIIREHGGLPKVRELNKLDFFKALKDKLLEESTELFSAESEEDLANEIADVLEVLDAIIIEVGLNMADVLAKKQAKKDERGGFEKKLFLESVD